MPFTEKRLYVGQVVACCMLNVSRCRSLADDCLNCLRNEEIRQLTSDYERKSALCIYLVKDLSWFSQQTVLKQFFTKTICSNNICAFKESFFGIQLAFFGEWKDNHVCTWISSRALITQRVVLFFSKWWTVENLSLACCSCFISQETPLCALARFLTYGNRDKEIFTNARLRYVIYQKPKASVCITILWKEEKKNAWGEIFLWAGYDIWIFNSSPLYDCEWKLKFHFDNCTWRQVVQFCSQHIWNSALTNQHEPWRSEQKERQKNKDF